MNRSTAKIRLSSGVANWPIFNKLLLAIVSIVVLALGVTTLINAIANQSRLREQVGHDFVTLSNSQLNHIADLLAGQIDIIQNLTTNDLVQRETASANDRYTGDQTAIMSELIEQNLAWMIAEDNSDLVQSIINPNRNNLTSLLLEYQAGYPDHVGIYITDRYGGLVAGTVRAWEYMLANEVWWVQAYNEGSGTTYIGQPKYDGATGMEVISIAVPIFDKYSAELLGIAYSTYRADVVYNILKRVPLEETQRLILINSIGRVIAASSVEDIATVMSPDWYASEVVGQSSTWRELKDENQTTVLTGFAHTANIQLGTSPANEEALRSLDWTLYLVQPTKYSYAPAHQNTRISIISAVFFAILSIGLTAFIARQIVSPIQELVNVTERMVEGDLEAKATIYGEDEIGQLARSFNRMTDGMNEWIAALEQRVTERTRDMQTAAEISQTTTALLDQEELIGKVVELVRDSFNLYYVGLFLLDETRKSAILEFGSGEAGRVMKEARHSLTVGGESMIGQCIARAEPRIAQQAGEEALRYVNPLLPDTRAELALPMRSRGRVIGAMTVQSTQPDTFSELNISTLQTMVDQVGVSIDNARLFQETQAALNRAEAVHRQYIQQSWAEYNRTRGQYQRLSTPEEDDEFLVRKLHAIKEPGVTTLRVTNGDGDDKLEGPLALVAPVTIGDEIIGALGVLDETSDREWTEEEIALVETITDRLGITAENLRLLDETQRRAAREQLIAEISGRIRETLDIEIVLRTVARELRQALNLAEVEIQMGTETLQGNEAEILDE
jgi:GAF domain-containing protein/HAMP domain-containing protein